MGVWYRAGTVAVTSGSKTVTGTGTQWQNLIFGVAPGVTFYGPDGKPYEIDTVNSNTSLTLATNYSGTTASGQAYAIDPTRSGSVASLAAQTSEVLKFSQGQFTQIQNWFTGAATADVTLTSPAGQTITVPSYSKVTSEGEGQAARAKTEADKAAASAALAGDIVVASALPLPDVWAPLSDSLRMITGYGREVKVGDDVVARMVNFSRNSTATYIGKDGQLKTAAANEPRFEKEGLLIEGQSTNLVIRSADMTQSPWSGNNAGTGVLPIVTGNYALAPDGSQSATRLILNKGVGTTAADTATISCPLNTTVGSTYTISVWLKSTDGVSQPKVSLSFNGEAGAIITVTGEWRRYQTTIPSATDASRFPRLQLRGGFGTSDSADLLVWGWQQEALPFASSYIPTSGAAAIRAADLLQFVGPGNHPDILSGVPFTLAVRMSCEEAPVGTQRDLMICPNVSFSLLRRALNTLRYYRDGSGQLSISSPGKAMNMVAVRVSAGNVCTLRVGSNQASRPEVPLSGGKVSTINITNVAGHVRDFRIWQHAITDDQMKAIA